jgi:hypothetical protein
VIEAAEDDMREWLEQFLQEVSGIQTFYETKFEELS